VLVVVDPPPPEPLELLELELARLDDALVAVVAESPSSLHAAATAAPVTRSVARKRCRFMGAAASNHHATAMRSRVPHI
jgi:hypothetical protein